jgi:murein DD-endopeptidase MepM/ murein hydrolase activator NlpD
MADGRADFFNDKGESVRKALLRTPIDGARLSSGFGKRLHPILGYTAMHRGVDFAAPAGTPIYAAGDGAVAEARFNGAYGKYVRIRHDGQYATAYAHLSRFGKDIATGKRVRQGDVIGYVGSTGRSTGAHLHYEILVAGQQTNPLKVKMPAGPKLAGRDLARFLKDKAAIERHVAEAEPAIPVRAADKR